MENKKKKKKIKSGGLAKKIFAWVMLFAMIASVFTIAISVLAS